MRNKKCKLAPSCLGNATMMHDEIILYQSFTSFVIHQNPKFQKSLVPRAMKLLLSYERKFVAKKKLNTREKINFILKYIRGGGSGR